MNFDIIVNKYSNLAYKIAVDMLSSPEEAQDIVQDSYLSLYNHFKEYRKLEENEIKNIFCRIVLNKCKDYLKSNAQIKNILTDNILEFERTCEKDSLDEYIKKEQSDYIRKKIEELKSPYNNLLKMYYIKDYSLDKISNLLNESKGTVKVQLTRAKHILKEILGKERFL